MFIVIATAYRSNLTDKENKARNIEALNLARKRVKICSLKRVTGYYREEISDAPTIEKSFLIAVKTRKEVKKLRDLFCNRYEQDCILFVNRASCQLIGASWQSKIGTRLKAVKSTDNLQAYTILENGLILTVV